MELLKSQAIQIFLVCVNTGMFLVALRYALFSRRILKKWLALSFFMSFLENVVALPAAFLGYKDYAWMIGRENTGYYLILVTVSMMSVIAGYWITLRLPIYRLSIFNYPELKVSSFRAAKIAFFISISGGALSILLSASGFFGYYINSEYLNNPPWWLDIARTGIKLTLAISFITFFFDHSDRHRLSVSSWLLVVIWTFAGLASGFKAQVVLPVFFVGLATWLTSRLKLINIAGILAMLFLAYGFVEPLRELRILNPNKTVLEAMEVVVAGVSVLDQSEFSVGELILRRIDYTPTAIEALEVDKYNRLKIYRDRLQEIYYLLPLLAFIPRAVWPEKPLADLGRELSIALSGNDMNSVTPSQVMASFFSFGIAGIIINSLFVGISIVFSARLFERYGRRPLQYFPMILLVLVFGIQDTIMAYHYIEVLRSLFLVAIFYWFAKRFGYVVKRKNR